MGGGGVCYFPHNILNPCAELASMRDPHKNIIITGFWENAQIDFTEYMNHSGYLGQDPE